MGKCLDQINNSKFEGVGWYYKLGLTLFPENLCFGSRLYKNELANFKSLANFLEIRNLMLMTIIPKKLNAADQKQSAYLRAAISRVSRNFTKFSFFRTKFSFQLAHKTAIDQEGIFSIRPFFYRDMGFIQKVMGKIMNINLGGFPKWGAIPSNFDVSYKTYYNTMHPHYDPQIHLGPRNF